MKIIGVDFTSAPSAKKPITWMACRLEADGRLVLEALHRATSFSAWEALLAAPVAWVGAFDFPFGQAAELVRALGWPTDWAGYVNHVQALGKASFETALLDFQASRPAGEKHLFRPTDRITRSSSPMKLHYPPVGKMFFQGAPRLLAADISILPCRPLADSPKIAMEGYPALVARYFGVKQYKSDAATEKAATMRQARQALWEGITASQCRSGYGIQVDPGDWTPEQVESLLLTPDGADGLDALLCAIQAAWACGRQDTDFGIPPGVDPNEGWIIDPACLTTPFSNTEEAVLNHL